MIRHTDARMNSPMNILLSTDANYLPHVRTLLCSLHVNNPGERFRVYLLHRALEDDALAGLASDARRVSCNVVPIRMGPALFEGAPVSRRYPQEMYYRLIAPSVLPESCKRVLYLDPDILVINPIRPLWNARLNGKLFAAAAHTLPTELLHEANKVRLNTEHRYFNSGVLLIDVDAARAQTGPEEVFRYAREHQSELLLPDQDVFNVLYGRRTLEVPDAVWNFDARRFAMHHLRSAGEIDLDWVMEHTAILHFCGKEKPWHERYRYRFGVLYKHYQHLTRRLLQTT